ncbi:MurR/RpiR family transcriptional regulator [Arthrobacter sp. 2MCAF15]|uniref:MurR/RpiR family transcriptional regulator n=1 Tax=Arthrobacter sp. 2MCAF15 TaxID=3232984 RepID=UPI003F908E72
MNYTVASVFHFVMCATCRLIINMVDTIGAAAAWVAPVIAGIVGIKSTPDVKFIRCHVRANLSSAAPPCDGNWQRKLGVEDQLTHSPTGRLDTVHKVPVSGQLSATVAERTRSQLGTFSPSETKVARALLAAYPAAGLETVAELALRARVSAPTVLRFASALGFEGYAAFQKALIREVHEEMGSPLQRLDDHDSRVDGGRTRSESASVFLDGLASTFDALPEAELGRAVNLLGDKRLRVHLLGGRFSRVLASYLNTHLVLMRPDVQLVPQGGHERMSALLDLGRRDVLVVFDFRRYDRSVIEFANRANAKGSHVVLFTDPWMSPAADVAEVVIPARVEAPSPFDSFVSAMAVVEMLIAAVAAHMGSSARSRLIEIEAMQSGDNAE